MGRHRSSSRSRSRSRSRDNQGTRIHIGDLPVECSKRELERAFEKFGPMMEVWMARTPPCFGFIVFENREDALEAVDAMNGHTLCGNRIRVSVALPRVQERGRRPSMFNDFRCYQCGEKGHFSRDCDNIGHNRNRWSPRRRSRTPPRRRRRSPSRSASRSRGRNRRSRDRHSSNEGRGSERRSKRDKKSSREETGQGDEASQDST